MSEVKFGTWETYKVGSGHWRVIQSDFPERLPVVTLDASRDGYEPFREVEVPARAHLIAAAPDMYDFIKRMADEYFFDDSEYGKEAAALLAKARGE